MSTSLALAWGMVDIPTPLPLPCIVHSAPRRPHDELSAIEASLAADSISLDLIEEEETSFSPSAKMSLDFPIYGLPRDSLCPWSLTSFEFERLKSETMPVSATAHSSADQMTSSTELRSSAQIQLSASSKVDLPPTPSSSANLTPAEQRKAECRAKHYSQSSRLTQQQHRQWWSSKSALPQSNTNDPLKVAVAAEQRLYKESTKQMVMETCNASFLAFPELVETCLEALYTELKSHASQYPPYYTLTGAMERTFLEMRQTVLAGGLPQRLPPISMIQRRAMLHAIGATFELPLIPTPFHSITLPRSGEFWVGLNQTRPQPDNAGLAGDHESKAPHPSIGNHSSASKIPTFLKQVQTPVSSDAIVYRLLTSHPEASIALSASTLCTLANPSVEVAWEVPVRVEEVLDEKHNLRKVVYLDKPLLARDMSIKQKNEKFYKMSFKRWLLQGQQGMKMDRTQSGANDPCPPQKSMPSLSQGPDNLVYTEWKVGDLKILLRTRVDALSCTSKQTSATGPDPSNSGPWDPQSKSPAPAAQSTPKSTTHHIPTAIASKMKHVPDSHLEELSVYERTKFLLKTHLLGEDARVLIGHVDPVSARLLSVESLSHQQLKAPNTPSIETCFTQLHDILTLCKTLPPGTFLLSHAPGDHKLSLAELHSQKEDVQFKSGIGATYDLHNRQRTAALSNRDLIEYLPPRWDYLRVNQIPNTFPPIGRSCCFDYLKSGKCNHPSSCLHLHITRYEAELRGIATPSHNVHADHPPTASSPNANEKKRKRKSGQAGPQSQSPKKYRAQ